MLCLLYYIAYIHVRAENFRQLVNLWPKKNSSEEKVQGFFFLLFFYLLFYSLIGGGEIAFLFQME